MELVEGFEKTVTSDMVESWRYPRFFTSEISENEAFLHGEEAKHCSQVLRMKCNDLAVLCDREGNDYLCRITASSSSEVVFLILSKKKNEAEASIYLRLFQCCPKSDKMEFIIQKATELGACEVIPVLSKRCVSRPDEKGAQKKQERYQRIAYEAAKQCGRGRILKVRPMITFGEAVEQFSPQNKGILFYECGGKPLGEIMNGVTSGNVDIFIGSEGGFEAEEAELAEKKGIAAATLGKRILRCETAPVAAISVLMNMTGNL